MVFNLIPKNQLRSILKAQQRADFKKGKKMNDQTNTQVVQLGEDLAGTNAVEQGIENSEIAFVQTDEEVGGTEIAA